MNYKLIYGIIRFMTPKKIVALIFIFAGLGTVAAFGTVSFLRSRKPTAALKIETTPAATVFVDNVQMGQTPFEKTFRPGEVTVKLIPDSVSPALTTYQTKVRLTNQVFTVIKREFAESDSQSSGEIISLQPQPGKTSGLSVITSGPDSASVTLDGQPQGLTPLSLASVSPGDHQLVISAPDYASRTVSAKAVAGFKLTVNVKLAVLNSDQLTPTPEAQPDQSLTGTPSATPAGKPTPTSKPKNTLPPTPTLARPYVLISSTPTGFLRVRSSPSTSASEIGQVKPGEAFPLLESQLGWLLIKVSLPATSSGWISSQYAQKFE